MAYCCAAQGNQKPAITGELVAANIFHEQWVQRSLTLDYYGKALKEGINRAHVEEGNQQ